MTISTAGVGNQLHVAILHNGQLWHRIRELNGQWSPWGQIIPPEGHSFEEVSCACSGNALHVVVKNQNGVYFHNIRRPDGAWQGFAQLPDQPLLA